MTTQPVYTSEVFGNGKQIYRSIKAFSINHELEIKTDLLNWHNTDRTLNHICFQAVATLKYKQLQNDRKHSTFVDTIIAGL